MKNMDKYVAWGTNGCEHRAWEMKQVGWSWRAIARALGVDKMTLWRKCAGASGDVSEEAWALGRVGGRQVRVWVTPSSEVVELAGYAKERQGGGPSLGMAMWVEAVKRDLGRGVAIRDIARASGLSRDSVRYRVQKYG